MVTACEAAVPKFAPDISRLTPPAVGPLAGIKLLITGLSYESEIAEVTDWPFTVTITALSLPVPAGTRHIIVVSFCLERGQLCPPTVTAP